MAKGAGKQFYKGNTKLKGAGVKIEFTQEQMSEYLRCRRDPVYFIEKYLKIVHIDKGLVPFRLYDYQKDIVRNTFENRFNILLLPRQSGKSSVNAGMVIHYILFQKHKKVAIIANKAATAREILSRAKLMYENLPFWMQSGVVSWNKGKIELANGCAVLAAATSSSAIRGDSINWLLLDEFAFVPTNQATEFFESVYPTISSGTDSKVSIFSTPKGMNHFHKMWVEASEGRSEFVPFQINWFDVPGRDEEWKRKTIANIGIESWEQEFEAQFLGSAGTLLSTSCLRKLVHRSPVKYSHPLKIYEEPIPGHVYVATVDCSRGAGIDYSVINVTDVTDYPFKQVAVYRDNTTTHYVLPSKIAEVGRKYNQAFVLIEINDIGEAVADALFFDEEYENILTTGESKGKIKLGSWINSKNGVRTTKSTKREGCSIAKTIIESNKYIINDLETINEFSTFIRKGTSYEADESAHDDIVMTVVIFAWASGQDYFKEITNKNLKRAILEQSVDEIMEDLSPLGVWEGLSNDEDGTWVAVQQ